MAKRKPARRKREPVQRTHAQWLEIAHWAEVGGNKEKADNIRRLAKERFCAVMTYGMNRSFARLFDRRRDPRATSAEGVPVALKD